jgi:hypothetical protein
MKHIKILLLIIGIVVVGCASKKGQIRVRNFNGRNLVVTKILVKPTSYIYTSEYTIIFLKDIDTKEIITHRTTKHTKFNVQVGDTIRNGTYTKNFFMNNDTDTLYYYYEVSQETIKQITKSN